MKLFVKYKNGSVEIVNVSELSYDKKNPCLKCRTGGGCYDHGCFMPEDWGDFLLSKSGDVSIRLQEVQVTDLFCKQNLFKNLNFHFQIFN